MIRYVKRSSLDEDKYNSCVDNSLQYRVYALSWYLDIVADNWGVLVLNNYQAVMPIPWKKKYLIKFVSQPSFCQQLGVFSSSKVTPELIQDFLKAIPKSFVKVNLQLNSNNILQSSNLKRVNHILEINKPYKTLFKSFSKGRKHAVKVGEKQGLFLKEISIDKLLAISREFYAKIQLTSAQFDTIENIANVITKNNKGEVLGVFNTAGDLLGGGVFLRDKNRIIYLFSRYTNAGKKEQAPSFLIASVIKNNKNYLLDFEGSTIKGIASFNKSFGANYEEYYQIIENKLPKYLQF